MVFGGYSLDYLGLSMGPDGSSHRHCNTNPKRERGPHSRFVRVARRVQNGGGIRPFLCTNRKLTTGHTDVTDRRVAVSSVSGKPLLCISFMALSVSSVQSVVKNPRN
jgi:hypothetical protein